ncbi:Planctomycete cytochrome C [Maioricimonas rarisocia]|uniref:Planctomycete cytochrome C n=1 Tax=Maioricimonas rarisocia TaxID=2528026 RepID=A0A517Z1N9_9PLAN|nr:PSD1 and planctomycete cytochrome C domain-containing protein [Maioricimonas rarisocia]QDU36401.1 Planctomycete cytochrome C [Maioricimonas rarisocia]
MQYRCILTTVLAMICFSGGPGPSRGIAAEPSDADRVDFVRDVRPLLESRCFDCHAADTREGGLRLDRRKAALVGGDSGQVIVPGDAGKSRLIRYVSGDDPDNVMPPDGEPLTGEQVALLTKWIEQGAEWPADADGPADEITHWAYQPLDRPDVPNVGDGEMPLSPVDAFVLQRLAQHQIEPSPQADRYTLIRRLYYDLLGLPPTPEAVDRFVSDTRDDAYARLVEELLQSPHFGERWGRHWLDVARYADSDGYEKDRPRYNAWKYRDWVIEAINDDMPFDQFTVEQIAGDLLPDPTPDQLLATAFHRQTLTNTEGGTDQEQWRVEAVFDRVETIGTAWLGLTVGCARCHTHKYDQITQREYYQLFAFLNNGDEVNTTIASSEEAMAAYREKKAAFDAELARRMAPLKAARSAAMEGFNAWAGNERERVLAADANGPLFHDLEVVEATSEGGATLTRQEDGSYLASGTRPPKDVYRLEAHVSAEAIAEQPVTGFELEVLTHESLPKKGPGWADNGNFVLSEFTVDVAADATNATRRLGFASASADFAQKGFDIAKAIDGDEGGNGWAISPQMSKGHRAVFLLQDPLVDAAGTMLTIRLSQQYKTPHPIGRFRVRAMTGRPVDSLELPENVIKLLRIEPEKRSDKQRSELESYFVSLDPEVKRLQADVDAWRKQEPFKPEMTVRVIRQRTENPRTTHVLRRGDFLQPLDPVEPDTLAVLPPLESRRSDRPADRLDFARWLVSDENPLTPRVVANQIWLRLFGRGLVKTVNDFGVRGEAPTHPQLLDWLASELVRTGWSRKEMIRRIVLSRTYRQSSVHRPELADVDPQNELLHRQNRFRVEAEIVRDLYLTASGLLETRVGGPSVFPPLPPDIASLSYANNFKWGRSEWNSRPDRPGGIAPQEDIYRRGMYTFFKRTAAHPTLTTFDCPDANTTCVDRPTSNTPLQALATLNNQVFVDAARAFAQRLLAESHADDTARVRRAFRLCVARPPSAAEIAALLQLLEESRGYYAGHTEEAALLAGDDVESAGSIDEAAAWVVVGRIILNMDEFITRE